MDAGHYLALIDLGRLATLPRSRDDEYDDLLALLRDHAAGPGRDTLARAVACGCLGDNHLWQDLGLPDRQTLSALLREHFPSLFARNTANMRWKKFFYLQLCEQAEIRACRAPTCGVCAHVGECFGTEDGMPLRRMRPAAEVATEPR